MGEYYSGSIKLGGKVSPEVLEEIYDLWQCDEWDEEGNGTFNECRVDDHDALIEFCESHDIALAIHWDADHGWDADVWFRVGGIKREFPADGDGDIVVKLKTLQENRDKSVEEFIASLAIPVMPSLELVRWYLEDAEGKMFGPFETYSAAATGAMGLDVKIVEREADE